MEKAINASAPPKLRWPRLVGDPSLAKKGIKIALLVLAVMVTLAYGYWGYRTHQRSRDLAELQDREKVMRRDLASLRSAEQNLAAAKPV